MTVVSLKDSVILKCADDTVVIGRITGGNEAALQVASNMV